MTDYTVGYKKPPQHSQFQKGQSGNPKGRKKGSKNLKTDIEEELSEQMVIHENGQAIKLSKQRVMVKSLSAKAIKGDTQSIRVLTDLVLKLIDQSDDTEAEEKLGATDLDIIDRFYNRVNPPKEQ